MTQSLQVVSGYWPAPGVDSPGRGVTGKKRATHVPSFPVFGVTPTGKTQRLEMGSSIYI